MGTRFGHRLKIKVVCFAAGRLRSSVCSSNPHRVCSHGRSCVFVGARFSFSLPKNEGLWGHASLLQVFPERGKGLVSMPVIGRDQRATALCLQGLPVGAVDPYPSNAGFWTTRFCGKFSFMFFREVSRAQHVGQASRLFVECDRITSLAWQNCQTKKRIVAVCHFRGSSFAGSVLWFRLSSL
jgi:hypothetical protein